jgi:hypothetical protein
MPEFVVSGMRYDFPKLLSRQKFLRAKTFASTIYLGFGKSAARNERNNALIGEGIDRVREE